MAEGGCLGGSCLASVVSEGALHACVVCGAQPSAEYSALCMATEAALAAKLRALESSVRSRPQSVPPSPELIAAVTGLHAPHPHHHLAAAVSSLAMEVLDAAGVSSLAMEVLDAAGV
jgi:hypothetical protein